MPSMGGPTLRGVRAHIPRQAFDGVLRIEGKTLHPTPESICSTHSRFDCPQFLILNSLPIIREIGIVIGYLVFGLGDTGS